ncbi:hypothetical protein RB594_006187 [Gaeumannomyces avenae]
MVNPAEVMAIEWLMLSLAWLLVGLRISVRFQMNKTRLLVVVSDLLLVLGALSILGLVICDTLTYRMGAMSDFGAIGEDLGKIRFATNYFFDAGLYLPKLSMLAIYYQLIPPHQRALRAGLYVVTAVTVAAVLITVFTDTFWCGPDPSVNWKVGENACSTFTSTTLMVSNWALCITIEALIFLLPIPLLRQVRSLASMQQAGLVVVFSLGVVTMMVSTGRFICMMSTGNYISIYIWATTEFAVSIMVVACMALRPLATKTWRATAGKITNRFSGNRSGGNHSVCGNHSVGGNKKGGPAGSTSASHRGTGARQPHHNQRNSSKAWQEPDGSDVQPTSFSADGVIMGNSVSVSSEGRRKSGPEPIFSHAVFREWEVTEHPAGAANHVKCVTPLWAPPNFGHFTSDTINALLYQNKSNSNKNKRISTRFFTSCLPITNSECLRPFSLSNLAYPKPRRRAVGTYRAPPFNADFKKAEPCGKLRNPSSGFPSSKKASLLIGFVRKKQQGAFQREEWCESLPK